MRISPASHPTRSPIASKAFRVSVIRLSPVSFGLGYVLVREGWPPLNMFVSGEWMAYRQFAPVAPQTTVRFGLNIAFPQLRPW